MSMAGGCRSMSKARPFCWSAAGIDHHDAHERGNRAYKKEYKNDTEIC